MANGLDTETLSSPSADPMALLSPVEVRQIYRTYRIVNSGAAFNVESVGATLDRLKLSLTYWNGRDDPKYLPT